MKVKKTVRSNPQGKSYNSYSIVGSSEMNIREIARMISDKKGIPLIRVMDVLHTVSDLLAEQLTEGNKIVIDGFGSFRPIAADNKTGKPEFSAVRFTPLQPFCRLMNETSIKVIG